jgi:hypothetical protein
MPLTLSRAIKPLIFFLLYLSLFAAEQRTELFKALYDEEQTTTLPAPYREISILKGQALFDALHQETGKNYRISRYRKAKRHLYDKVDHLRGMVFTLYSAVFGRRRGEKYFEVGDENRDGNSGDFVNCEHLWPQSKFSKKAPMVSDLHHLYPSLSIPNHVRSNFPFGLVESTEYKTFAGSKFGQNKFEPHDEVKGNVARALLYFVLRYKNRAILKNTDKDWFWNDSIAMYFSWHQQDPPDEWERTRNDRIERYQKNRNPFIDAPTLVELIGESPFRL